MDLQKGLQWKLQEKPYMESYVHPSYGPTIPALDDINPVAYYTTFLPEVLVYKVVQDLYRQQ